MNKFLIILTVLMICSSAASFAQETAFSRNSLKTGFGIGISEGKRESGMGTLFSMGYQRSYWNDRVRVNPNLITGGFMPLLMLHTRSQYFRITSIGVNGYVDAIKYRSVSLFFGTGVFVNYSRGLLGTGGDKYIHHTSSQYFSELYFGGKLNGGIRIDPKDSRLAFELAPVNIHLGNDYFLLGYMKAGVDIKLNAPARN